MSREAIYPNKGFVYQFNKTLEQILSAPDGTEITVEGIIEDIDVVSAGTTKAIQCKYHGTKNKYKLSDISKPILQMLVHYAKNKDENIQYILYAHFTEETEGEKEITKDDIETILKSRNKSYIRYISALKPPKTIDIDSFLKPEKFKFIIGRSFDDLTSDTEKLLETKCDFSKADVEELFYPNAIQKISAKSILHGSENRKINNTNFISELKKIKKTAITRWTRELSTYSKLLEKRRSQLRSNLQKNHRLRYFLFNESNIEDFENEIIIFISNYISKYHHKIKLHSKTPVFCIKTGNDNLMPQIESRLHQKELKYQNGVKGNDFYQVEFLREPQIKEKEEWREFQLRICRYNTDTVNAINSKKSDDLFIIGKGDFKEIDTQDINIESLEVPNLKELQYLLMLTNKLE